VAGDMIRCMIDQPGSEYEGRLRRTAVALVMPMGPGLDEAIELAEDLVAAGLSGPSTLAVATLLSTIT
jgi:hypothetical protein